MKSLSLWPLSISAVIFVVLSVSPSHGQKINFALPDSGDTHAMSLVCGINIVDMLTSASLMTFFNSLTASRILIQDKNTELQEIYYERKKNSYWYEIPLEKLSKAKAISIKYVGIIVANDSINVPIKITFVISERLISVFQEEPCQVEYCIIPDYNFDHGFDYTDMILENSKQLDDLFWNRLQAVCSK